MMLKALHEDEEEWGAHLGYLHPVVQVLECHGHGLERQHHALSLQLLPTQKARHTPSTLANNTQGLASTQLQACDVYASSPDMAGYDWRGPSSLEKLMHLVHALHSDCLERELSRAGEQA